MPAELRILTTREEIENFEINLAEEVKKKSMEMNKASTRYRFDRVKPFFDGKIDYLRTAVKSEVDLKKAWEKMTRKYEDEEVYILGVVSACERLYPGEVIFALVIVSSEDWPARKFENLWERFHLYLDANLRKVNIYKK